MNDQLQFISLILLLLVVTGCSNEEEVEKRSFWYPVKLVEATCPGLTGEFYLMTNTTGWRSWAYYLDISNKKEIRLSESCSIKTLRDLQRYKGRITELHLTDEQREFMIRGF